MNVLVFGVDVTYIISWTLIVCLALGIMSFLKWGIKELVAKPKKGRIGIIEFEAFNWHQLSYNYELMKFTAKDVVIVVEELERIEEYSKIKILEVHGKNFTKKGMKECKEYVSTLIHSNKIKWSKDTETDAEVIPILRNKLSDEQVIKTPLNDLVKYIENEKIDL